MLHKFITQLRKKHDLTQEFIATELGMSRPTYIQFEQGGRDLTISEATKLAHLFSISLDDLLHERITKFTIDITKQTSNTKKDDLEIRISIPQQKIDKFKQILLYILKKVGGKSNIGMTAIYKLLYFIDLDYYEKYEEQLMGLIYIKNHFGPTPVAFEKIMQDLIQSNQVEAIKSKFYQHEQKKYLINPEIEPDLKVINGKEKEHIDWELQRLSELTAKSLSDLSHKDVPWLSAEQGKPIDYESVFYRTAETSVRDYIDDEQD